MMGEEPRRSTGHVEIRRAGPGDEAALRQAESLFDAPSHAEAVRTFLADPRNYLLIAYVEGQAAGFVRAHELARLNTPRPMMFLYEIGVAEGYRGRGVGTALVRELARQSEERGCCEMFVLTSESNAPAMRLYAAAGGRRSEERDLAMFEWSWVNRGGTI